MAEIFLIRKNSENVLIIFLSLFLAIIIIGCEEKKEPNSSNYLDFSNNILDYRVSPKDSLDKSGLMFSDQGAWFAYGLTDSTSVQSGFTGPFLMTQQNGIWASKCLASLVLKSKKNTEVIDWKHTLTSQSSYSSHLSQTFENTDLSITQELTFLSGHTALQRNSITNTTEKGITIYPSYSGELFDIGISVSSEENTVVLSSEKSLAKGYFQILGESVSIMADSSFYTAHLETIFLKPMETKHIVTVQSFVFPEYSWEEEKVIIFDTDFDSVLSARQSEKEMQLDSLLSKQRSEFSEEKYSEVIAKAQLTLQNNWRIPAGEIKHSGLFPSYHYKWFNGFWSWDSWKHAVGLSYYDTDLAKEQVKLMFDFQNEDGFVADCVFRDTLIEKHNYRDTKPPLSAWAAAKIYEKDADLEFLKEIYPKLKNYHDWWYENRDHDGDGLCEYGSTDGSLLAAKWESGMDNAIRFDNSKILKNKDGAYSLDQESVDLNAYLYAEKLYLSAIAQAIQKTADAEAFNNEALELKSLIQTQFFDENDGWFYDTNLDGTIFIKGEGSEGWTALWANVASKEQANSVMTKMMDPEKFFTKVPFQTMSADHEKFDPLKGYWRGPNWLDQAYFGVKGLRNYGFAEEATKATVQIIKGANGVLGKGSSIRENYHPISGEGLNAHNFSWSAAHLIMLLMED